MAKNILIGVGAVALLLVIGALILVGWFFSANNQLVASQESVLLTHGEPLPYTLDLSRQTAGTYFYTVRAVRTESVGARPRGS